MSIYVKQFDTVANSAFSKITIKQKGGASVVTGNLNAAACLMTLDVNGNVLTQFEYTLTNAQISFSTCFELADGYLVFGEQKTNQDRSQALVARLDNEGTVLWAKNYGNENTIKAIGIVPADPGSKFPEAFVIAHRNSKTAGRDDVELIKIDSKGAVLKSKILGVQVDSATALNLSLFPSGAAVFGGTNEENGQKAFILGFDFSLKVTYLKKLGGGLQQSILALNIIGEQIVATGLVQRVKPSLPTGGKKVAEILKESFIIKFDTKTTVTQSKVFDLMPGFDTGSRVLMNDGDKTPSFYLLATQVDANSIAAKFDNQLNLQWVKLLNTANKHSITDGLYSIPDNEMLFCGWTGNEAQKNPLLYRTDKTYATCITLENPKPVITDIEVQFQDWLIEESLYQPSVKDVILQKQTDPVYSRFVCPIEAINTAGLIQSPYLYLQAVGSDQTDDSFKGAHLRWRFQKSLGQHFAKGNYADPLSPYFTSIGFNKPNDFVKIFRAPYTQPYSTKVQIRETILPTVEVRSGAIRTWRFNNVAVTGGTGTNNVHIRFKDFAQYDTIRASMTSLLPETFMKQYKGLIEVESPGKLFFAAQFSVAYNTGNTAQAYLRTEAISFDDPADPATIFVASRKKYLGSTQLNTVKITGENLKYIRLDYSIAYISEITIETYFDFIANTKNQTGGNGWQFLNNFALTLDTATAFDRLENKNNAYIPSNKKYSIDKQWNKYNDANAATGAFKIRVDNYKHRWYPVANTEHPTSKVKDGIQDAVEQYLTLSKTDVKAVASLLTDDTNNLATIDISYFDVLRLVGLDFHAARMLGLGHIDADIANNATPYVYLMTYTSKGALESGNPQSTIQDHLYMSLPTALTDYRLPLLPVQLPVTYGMTKDMGFGVMNPLTDPNGYVPFDNVRFVNIHREAYNYEKPFGDFFVEATEFSLSDTTIPIKYGLEYKERSEAVYRKPEIIQDEEYYDHANINEVVEIPERGGKPLYVHQEREEGEHTYGLYAINWFSRVSPPSNQQSTNYTKFTKIKSLLPPSNFAVQLIQPEETPMLTTTKEQERLALMVGADKTLLRATFDWNHNHNVNYPFAERAQFFYRDAPADSIRGEVATITQLPDNKIQVKVKEFIITSTNPIETVAPLIPVGSEQKYIGSLFALGQNAFVIDAIYNNGSGYPEFVLNQIKQTESSDPLNNNQIITIVTWLKPKVGDRFLVAENLSVSNNWSTHLQRMVYIEKFHTNQVISIESTGTANNGIYRLEQVINKTGGQADLVLLDKLKNEVVAGNIRYERVFRLHSLNPGTKKMGIKGNVASDFANGATFRLFGSSYKNDQYYTVVGNSSYNTIQDVTAITFSGTIPDTMANFGYVAVEKTAQILALNRKTKTVTVKGILSQVVKPPYVETKIENDGTATKLVYGGVFLPAKVDVRFDIIDYGGNVKPIYVHIGAYTVTFENGYALPPHIDPSVEWHKGVARILEDKPLNPNRKSLQVWEIVKDANGKVKVPLELIVFDPDFVQNPIKDGSNVMVNFHPSYRLYLNAEFNASNANDATHQFNAATIMPAFGDGSKMTYMGVRSIDRFKEPSSNNIIQYDSYIAPLVPVLAREVVEPKVIKTTGPKFATRPDFYKKSTYTIDLKLDTTQETGSTQGRKPYGVLAYRGSETQILGTLYSDETLFKLLPDIEKLKSEDTDRAAYFTMLSNLVHVVVDTVGNTAGEFTSMQNSINFKFPLPDNAHYIIPDRDPKIKIQGFLTNTGTPIPIKMNTPEQIFIVKRAILDSFLSLTEQPVIYKYVKGGIATSGKKPVFRNNNGDLIAPVLPEDPLYDSDKYDPHPMAVKFAKTPSGATLLPQDSNYSDSNNEFYIRFTDFTLDGASKAYYFYYACEITNQLTIGKVDNIIGPVLMVNTAPAEAPGIREVRTILANPVAGDVTSVLFKLNPYNKSEGITQFWIYRAYDAADASNIRSMHPPVKVNANKEVIDSFSDLAFPPYGETLFYRIVAIRRIKNELSKDEDILSLPSKLVQTSIVDVINPLAPKLMAKNGLTTPTALQNVLLKWNATAYNGAYYLQKQNASGNWVEMYRTKVKDAAMQYPPLNANNLPDFANFSETQNLSRVDSDGNAIYHRFRVQVENASGLFNLSEFELTLAKGASDLQETNSVLSFADGNNHQMTVLSSSNIVAGASQPGQMTFTHRNNLLPAGHNTFNKIEITVSDDLGKSFTKDISTPAGKVVFNHGDGGLIMDASKPNRVYTIRTKLFTDYAPNGAVQVFTINYLSGACNNLKTIKSLIQISDDTHDFDPSAISTVNNGVSCPKVLKIAASTQFLALGQTLVQMVIAIKDDLGNTAIKTITQINTQVVFDQNDSLVLDASNPNRSYEIQLKVSTLECSQDRAETYRIFYSCPPSNELAKLKDIAQFVDNNQTNLQLIVGENLKAFAHANGKITIYEMISGNLPAGHQFISMEVILKDDIGNQSKDTIQNAGDSVVFHHVEGGLWLNYSKISRVYFITLVLRTNLCPDGYSYIFTVKY